MFKKLLSSHFFLALIILGLFLVTNRYIYGWDDQALEIPLLKHLIDPDLFATDYYVQSLKKNFTSYMYPLLAKVISVDQIPAAYLFLYLISRYFLFFFSIKLWHLISSKTSVAVCATLMSFLIGRTEEFLYRTFSHQEFALAIILAGLYCFYKERYVIAALLFGAAANFNALYALYPTIYLCTYLLFTKQFKNLFASAGSFVLAVLPFLWWTLPKKFAGGAPQDPTLYEGWQRLFLLACPQNFLFQERALSTVFADFKTAAFALGPYLFLIVLYLFNLTFNRPFRDNQKSQALCLCAFFLLVVSFVFSYMAPNRFFIDLNLIRNTQFLTFILMGYTTVWVCGRLKENSLSQSLWAAVLFSLLGFRDLIGVCVILLVAIILVLKGKTSDEGRGDDRRQIIVQLIDIFVLCTLYFLLHKLFALSGIKYYFLIGIAVSLSLCYLALLFIKPSRQTTRAKSLFVIIPLMGMAIYFCFLHYQYIRVTTKGGGFWQLQRNWEDMQAYVKANTPKDALLMVPYDMEMGGFRIGSERTIIASYRDCGIVGFDYAALKDWERRIKDIEAFRVIPQGPLKSALVNGLAKYQADYIVFTRFVAPKKSNTALKKVYANEIFSLFEVQRRAKILP